MNGFLVIYPYFIPTTAFVFDDSISFKPTKKATGSELSKKSLNFSLFLNIKTNVLFISLSNDGILSLNNQNGSPMNIPETNLPRIVIIGGGFGGLNLAKSLKNTEAQVVLIDKHNYHTFQPLLYQVATAGLEPDSIAYPIRKIFKKQKNFFFRVAEVQNIQTNNNILETTIGNLEYDHLVIATGSKSNYFGNDVIERLSMPMKFVPQALNLRSLILQNFEAALLTNDLEERKSLMNYVIVGGGPTGTELAGALAELKRHVLPKDYPDLDLRQMNIHIIEAAPRVLAAMSPEASSKALKFLKKMGVNVWLDTMVKDYDGDLIKTSNKDLNSKTLIWAAGVQGSSPIGISSDIIKGGRIKTDEYNKAIGYNNIYAIGDVALMESEENPKGYPMVAQPAIQQGKNLAKNFKRSFKNQKLKPFVYKDLGSMATIGRNLAVADLPKIKLQGFIAWLIWMFVHLMALVGFRNKVIALFNWVWGYLRYDKGVRLIIRPYKRATKEQEEEVLS